MAIITNKNFEYVEQKIENDVYELHSVAEIAEGYRVELRGDGSKVDGTGVKALEIYMENEEEFEKVVDKYK